MLDRIFGLHGKVSLVTGSGRGLGRVAAIGLAEAGSDVVLVSRTLSEIEAVAREIESLGRKALVLKADLAEYETVHWLVDKTIEEFGRLDVLVNNASVIVRESVRETRWDNYDFQMDVNLKATFALCRAAIPPMTAQGAGKIVNLTSLAATLGSGNYSAYGISKAGVSNFTKTLAIELARDRINIQANCIGPGMFATQMNDIANDIDPAFEQHILSKIPMGRAAHPDEIKGLVIFLASSASSYITGNDIYIDGGWLANGA